MEPDLIPQRSSASDSASPLATAVAPAEAPVESSDRDPEVLVPRDLVLQANGAPCPNGADHVNGNGHANGNGYANGVAVANGNGHAVAVHALAAGRDAGMPLAMRVPVFARAGSGAIAGRAAVLEAAAFSPAVPADGWLEELHPPRTVYLRCGKRALDVALAAVGLVLSAPVLLAFAAAIKVDSRGPILYKSTRLGKDGKAFTFYKLRSMYTGAEEERARLQPLNECDGPAFKLTRDPRTTRIGRFIRQTSIDELPQFLNVLRGEMSLVGPRPPLPEEVAKYESWHRRRLEVKPGLTCLWQISGRSRLGFNEWMRLDLEYIKRQSFWTDARILLRTIPAVLSREGAY
jgi:lipopolysaccharide/colanic/teichoic acid biosynthesis glycosyltransferase